jgi:N-acetylglucosamine-6-phosphate deacetylase
MKKTGFIDLQVNGYKGVDFSSAGLTFEGIARAAGELRRAGTAGFCATLITSDLEVYRANLDLIARAMEDPSLRGCLLGIHMEGPYLSPEDGARGAHSPSKMRLPDPVEFDRFQEWAHGRIVITTLAPELPGAVRLIRHIRERYGTAVALGHHLADRETIRHAAEAGATLITHLGNGCPASLPRHDNPILSQLANDSLMAGLITDGHHIPADFIKIVLRCKGSDRIFVVSDAAPIAGLRPGIYENLGNKVRLTESGRIECVDTPFFAGSGRTMADCMRYLKSLELMSEDQLWQAGFVRPLEIIGIPPESLNTGNLPEFAW